MRFARFAIASLLAFALAGACSDGTEPPDARPMNTFDATGSGSDAAEIDARIDAAPAADAAIDAAPIDAAPVDATTD